MIAVKVEGVLKQYKMGKVMIDALKGVDLEVAQGEIICIMGPSGSGKTTLLNIIGGIDYAQRGKVYIYGEDITRFNDTALSDFRNRFLGFIFQSFNLIPVLTAFENIEYPLLLQKVSKNERRKKVSEIMEMIGLAEYKNHKPDELSGGQRQRVAIGRALVTKPKIVVADEPTANLDHETGKNIMELIKDMNVTMNTTFIFSSHDMFVTSYANRIVNIIDGRILN